MTDAVYGLLGLGELDLALPLSALREVVPRPAALAPLPVSAPGLAGAMALRSIVLPVVDLRPLLGAADQAPADQVVVVVRHEHRVIGLVVDQVRGVARVPDADLVPFATASGDLLVSHAFLLGEERQPVSVLDAAQLLGLPGVPSVSDEPAAAAVEDARATGSAPSLTLVRCGDQVLALDVDAIHTTLPLIELRPSVLTAGDCLGTTAFGGREVPVVDPMTLVGLPALGADDVRAGVVLDLGVGQVVLAVTDLVELRAAGSEVLPVPRFAASRPDLVSGMLALDDGACLVLDGPGLRSDRSLLALAAVNTDLDIGSGAGDSADGVDLTRAPAYVTYSAGIGLATPLDQVVEILPPPTSLTPSAVADVLGTVVHRGHAVPVLSLARLLGHEPAEPGPSSCLLLVELGDEQVGFAVDALVGIEPRSWSDPEHDGRGLVEARRAVQDSPLIRLAGGTRLVPDLDLRALARVVGLTDLEEAAA
ncbi:chemotaxis protein CheW [Nocardioides sp. SR21]|uniref:chemotaxis protein CheW n=1 Tax=Nocardioides sp. SR21 TaxID=2919501 RepID=UPI001FAAB299|nr:chemotaxis protein CheW [Nocardioides sp. SR21]